MISFRKTVCFECFSKRMPTVEGQSGCNSVTGPKPQVPCPGVLLQGSGPMVLSAGGNVHREPSHLREG